MVSYQDSAVDIETRYAVEFVNNKKDWDYICKGIFNHGEPWERYQSRKYSSLDDAISGRSSMVVPYAFLRLAVLL